MGYIKCLCQHQIRTVSMFPPSHRASTLAFVSCDARSRRALPVTDSALLLPRHKRLRRVVPDALDNPKPFGPALPKEKPVPRRQVLGPLNKPKGNGGAVSGPNERAVDVDDGASLRHRPDMQHRLVLRLDGRCMGQDEDCSRSACKTSCCPRPRYGARNTFSHELAVDFGRGPVGFGQDNHSFADILPSDSPQSKRRGLASRRRGDAYPLSLDGTDRCLREAP